jgi:hypothetical protein
VAGGSEVEACKFNSSPLYILRGGNEVSEIRSEYLVTLIPMRNYYLVANVYLSCQHMSIEINTLYYLQESGALVGTKLT